MSTVLSPSLMEIDHSTDHSTPSKSFTREPSSSNSHTNNKNDHPKQPVSDSSPGAPETASSPRPGAPEPVSSPRPGAPEPVSPPSPSAANASMNGHAPESKEEVRQVPSQASLHLREERSRKAREGQSNRAKDDTDRDDVGPLPSSDPDDADDIGSGESDGDWSQDDIEADIRRVKVYELIGQKWTDRGTAFCQGDYDEDARQARLIARAEHSNELLLQCIIRATDVYQRQQDTLIVWTEPDGTDYALSFQDTDGCGEVWEFIGEVQRHLQEKAEEEAAASGSGSSMHVFPAGNTNPLVAAPKLPIPSLGNMHECERIIRQVTRQPHGKEKLCRLLMANDYVKRVIDVMHQAEDLEDIKELHACCSCMQAILLINDHDLYEYVLQDSIFKDVLGVLEYDPEFPTHKASYREFLETSARFREPIPIRDPQTRNKIHQTYRLQILKDFILARATDDATFSVLNSSIIFNQIDIITSIQQDDRFLRELVGLFLTSDNGDTKKEKEKERVERDKGNVKDGVESSKGNDRLAETSPAAGESKANGVSTNGAAPQSPEIGPQPQAVPGVRGPPAYSYTLDDRRKDTILLIQQLCLMGKNVQLPTRMQLFRTLVDRGVLHAVQWALGRSEVPMLSTGGEVLSIILDHDVGGVRQHVMKQVALAGKANMGMSVGVTRQGDPTDVEPKRETLLETLCRSLANGQEQAYRTQMTDALRSVLDVPQTDGMLENNLVALRAMTRAKDDPVTERFLEYFYQKCCENLFRPFAELPEHHQVTGRILQISRDRSNLYLYLCDLLTSFTLQHSFRSHFLIISSTNGLPPLIPRVSSLLKAREKHLRLAALRFFRATLKLGNRNIFLQLIKHDAILPILNLTIHEAKWDNLLSSSCQEFFEHIRRDNLRELLENLMTRHGEKVRQLAESAVCGERFQNLIRRWEINKEPLPKETDKPHPAAPVIRKWGQGRLLEAEEEDYFNNSDEEDTPSPLRPPGSWTPISISPIGSTSALKRKRGKGLTGPQKQSKPLPRVSTSLVDYEEEEEEDITSAAASSSSTRPTSSAPTSEKLKSLPASPKRGSPPPFKPVNWFAGLQGSSSTPVLRSSSKHADVESELDLGSASASASGSVAAPGSPPRLGEKRRRIAEDDEDEMLERLVRTKRQTTEKGSKSDSPKAGTGKLKLKLGSTSLSLGSSSGGVLPEKKKEDDDSGG